MKKQRGKSVPEKRLMWRGRSNPIGHFCSCSGKEKNNLEGEKSLFIKKKGNWASLKPPSNLWVNERGERREIELDQSWSDLFSGGRSPLSTSTKSHPAEVSKFRNETRRLSSYETREIRSDCCMWNGREHLHESSECMRDQTEGLSLAACKKELFYMRGK